MKLTLEIIKSKSPCQSGWHTLLKSLNKIEADDTEISIDHLLESNGIDDTIWVIYNCIDGELSKKRNMCADFAESVVHIWEKWAKDNAPEHFSAPRNAINICRDDNAGVAARDAAADAADAARYAAAAARDAVRGAADAAGYAARGAADAAGDAARDAAWAADAAAAARYAAAAARDAAWAAAAAARDAERNKQKQIILKYFG